MLRSLLVLALGLVSCTVAAQQPRVDLEGRLIRQSGRTVLRVGSDVYALRFPSTSLMTFSNELLGEDVRVQGTLHLQSDTRGQSAVVTPERIDRLGTDASVAVDPEPIETTADLDVVEPAPAPGPAPRTRTRVERRKALVRDTDPDQPTTPFYDRVDRRKQSLRSRARERSYNDVYITPGGGVIIENR